MSFALLLSVLFQLFGGSHNPPPPPDTSGVLTGARVHPSDTSGVLTGRKPAHEKRAMDTSGSITG